MAWFESHQSLKTHHKTKRLSKLLGLTRRDTIGLLHMFWWMCIDHAQDGILRNVTPEYVAKECDWDEDPVLLLKCLWKAGFVDAIGDVSQDANGNATGSFQIHDWVEMRYAYNVLLADIQLRREKVRQRVIRFRAKQGGHAAVENGEPDASVTLKDPSDVTLQPADVTLRSRKNTRAHSNVFNVVKDFKVSKDFKDVKDLKNSGLKSHEFSDVDVSSAHFSNSPLRIRSSDFKDFKGLLKNSERTRALGGEETLQQDSTAREYRIPEPSQEPADALVMAFKDLKGVQYDDREWDKSSWGKQRVFAERLLKACGTYAKAYECLRYFATIFGKRGYREWTLRAIADRAAEWIGSGKEKVHGMAHSSGFFEALNKQRGLAKADPTAGGTAGKMLHRIRDLQSVGQHTSGNDRREPRNGHERPMG